MTSSSSGAPDEPNKPDGERRVAKLLLTGAAFLVGFAVLLVLMLPNPWAFGAGALFGVAAAAGTYGSISGRELRMRRRYDEMTDLKGSLKASLQQTEQIVLERSGEFPPSTHSKLRMILVGLDEIVERWDTLERVPSRQDAVQATIDRHLPRTLQLYCDLPMDEKIQHAEEFREQVTLMSDAVARTRDHVVRREIQALRANRGLIEDSLLDPDEKLFNDHGL